MHFKFIELQLLLLNLKQFHKAHFEKSARMQY